MQNMIVLHFLDGKIMKGFTGDFFPNKNLFHITDKETGEIFKIDISQLKGIFFVKSFEGNRNYKERQDVERPGLGKKVKIHFKDGETIIGYTSGYSPDRNGFFLFPSDPMSNTEKVFVVKTATNEIRFL